MIEFDIRQLVPQFLMRDKNGYALSKALEAALQVMIGVVHTGVMLMDNVNEMPEWRLDELAWEYNCLYDYKGSITEKRKWISTAMPIYRIYGTLKAIYTYLEGVFDSIEVEESWKYDGHPYHFRMTVTGDWTREKREWATMAISTAKNVRSVLDNIAVGSKCDILIAAQAGMVAKVLYPLAGEYMLCGGDGL